MITPQVGQTWKIHAHPASGASIDKNVNVVHRNDALGYNVISDHGMLFTDTVTDEWLNEYGTYLPDAPKTLEVKDFDAEEL